MKKILITMLFLASAKLFAQNISVQINPGEQWNKRVPQCAIWLEDENNNYIDTIFVTNRASKKNWLFAPKNGRPESLPVWYGKSNGNHNTGVSKKYDAVTCATPKKTFFAESKVSLNPEKKYFIKIEVNQSFDYNEKWTKNNSAPNGQPSLIYQSSFFGNKKQFINDFILSGIGSVDGKSSDYSLNDIDYITSAKFIIKSISAEIF